ncbi:MAG: CRTAC1 family protein [Rhodothermia bacterium]|nr:CRTAC1 family protein [Rhodothermia bacterium]
MAAFIVVAFIGCRQGNDTTPDGSATTEESTIQFSNVTASAGLGEFRHFNGAQGQKWFPETMGSGAGFIDYDSDGWQDILLVGGGTWTEEDPSDVRSLWLFRNNGDGTFSDRTLETSLAEYRDYGMGVAVADYDNDGDDDFYYTTIDRNRLFRNDGGRFVDVSEDAGVAGGSLWSTAAAFTDVDRDGMVDLYVGNYVNWSPENDVLCSRGDGVKIYCTPQLYAGAPAYFFRNLGDGVFEDATVRSNLGGAGKTLGAVELDFDSDGWPDIVVANDTNPDHLFRNEGDGTFEDVGVVSGIAFDEHGRARAGMGIDAGYVDADGHPTIVVGNFSDEMIGFYKYIGNGIFVDRAAASQIGRTSLRTLTFGLFLFDVDLDGDLDLFAANGHVQQDIETVRDNTTYRQVPHLFENRGDGTFEDVTTTIGEPLTRPMVARGAAYADYDKDGDLDVLLTENDGPAHLWRNETSPSPRFIRVETTGTVSNMSGVGATVTVWIGDRSQRRSVRAGGSYLSQSELGLTFGLGESTMADSVLVAWPSGQRDLYYEVTAGRTIVAVESQSISMLSD